MSTSPTRRLVRDLHRDSTQWDSFQPRTDDIVIASSYRSGTTLTQQIINLLIHGPDDICHFRHRSPWVDSIELYPGPAAVEAIKARRFLKSHLPFDALPQHKGWRYVYLVRDGRDVCLSLFEHSRALARERPFDRNGVAFDYGAADFPTFYDRWLEDGHPYWPQWSDIASWWTARSRRDVVLIRFDALVGDKARVVRELASFLDLRWTPEIGEMVTRCSSLAHMQALERAGKFGKPEPKDEAKFINKGIAGRWRELLTTAQAERYEALLEDRLPPACVDWIRSGSDKAP